MPEGGFFRTAKLDALPFLDGLHVSRGVMQAAARPCVQPRKAAVQPPNPQLAAAQILHVHIGDFKLATGRRFQGFGDRDHVVVVNIKSRDGVIAFRLFGLFFDADRAPEFRNALGISVLIKINHCQSRDGHRFIFVQR